MFLAAKLSVFSEYFLDLHQARGHTTFCLRCMAVGS